MKVELVTGTHEEQRSYYLDCQDGESIYEAADRASITLPISCRNGVCHICRAQLQVGAVLTGNDRHEVVVLQQDEKNQTPDIMLCKTWPELPCKIAVKNLYGPGELPLKKLACQILSIDVIQGHVYQVELQLPAGKLPEFFAGQYLSLNLPGREEPVFFSIASRPGLRILTLHIQADPHLESALENVETLQNSFKNKLAVSISLPFGAACVTEFPSKPLILMAAGTGFAQMKSIIEHLYSLDYAHPVSLYWGVRKQEDMYLQSLAMEWAARYENFTFQPLIADIDAIDNSQTREHHNQLSDAVLADQPELENSLVFVSGSPKLVFSAMDALLEKGLPESQFFSDVLEYASRD